MDLGIIWGLIPVRGAERRPQWPEAAAGLHILEGKRTAASGISEGQEGVFWGEDIEGAGHHRLSLTNVPSHKSPLIATETRQARPLRSSGPLPTTTILHALLLREARGPCGDPVQC